MPTLTVTNPANGQTLTQLPADDAASVARKFEAARARQPAWAALPLAERLAIMRRFRSSVEAEREQLAAILMRETGKPIRLARNELTSFLGRVDFFLDQVTPSTRLETVWQDGGMTEQIEHVPLGVVGNISAWNYPWFVGGNVFVPALLTGNAVLYKPSEFASMSGQAMQRLLLAAGVWPEMFALLLGTGDVGGALLMQPIDGLFFTGSYATGAKIAGVLGPRMVKLQLELGGKDPTYVCEDVNVAAAAESLADGAMYNTGQSCCSVERIYVHRDIYAPFLEAFVQSAQSFKIGDPADEASYIGPLTRAPQVQVLEAQVRDALDKGGRLLLGGKRLPGPGNWFEPTVIADAQHSMELMREESFGPIIGIQPVASDAEALSLMNDTPYGLTAGVYTRSSDRAKAILAQVKSGSAYWNCCDRVSPRLPWSGYGHSGVGLTLSTYGIQTFTRPRAWHLKAV